MHPHIEALNWRYATKKYNTTRKISNEDLAILLESIRLSPSSYGLQPFQVLIIENPEIRAQLKPVSWNQSIITDASHLIVFANKTAITESDIDTYMQKVSATRNVPLENVAGYGNYMKSKILDLTPEQINTWTSKQTYIALGNLLSAAAELKIDSTPIEGFEREPFNEILGLDKLGLSASVLATVGYRLEEDANQFNKKVRKTTEELFITI